MAFVHGDVVRLKSATFGMTIEKVSEAGVHCVWFDSKYNLHKEIFHKSTLEIFEMPKEE